MTSVSKLYSMTEADCFADHEIVRHVIRGNNDNARYATYNKTADRFISGYTEYNTLRDFVEAHFTELNSPYIKSRDIWNRCDIRIGEGWVNILDYRRRKLSRL